MKSLYQFIDEMNLGEWHYYFGLDNNFEAQKPFVDNLNYSSFIVDYFQRGGKVQIFESCNIRPQDLRLPNHICSVFFLGVLLYNRTGFSKSYKLAKNSPGYETFPFIWFLIALFHDNAYQMEDEDELKDVHTIPQLFARFDITHSLFDRKFSKCAELLDCRENYFLFRKEKWKVVDHGILGGILLFDRLVKIRREKKRINEDGLFWGRRLENQYKNAANAISIHNIWLQSDTIGKQFGLDSLMNFQPIKFEDFPLFYILAVVDTIEPLKTYRNYNISDLDILKSINFEFGNNF